MLFLDLKKILGKNLVFYIGNLAFFIINWLKSLKKLHFLFMNDGNG